MDGVFDMFHRGHLESFKYIKNKYPDSKLVVGIINDIECKTYKRLPIIHETDRVEIIKAIKYVDHIIFPAPLILTYEFINTNNIDIIVHGFSDENDKEKQKEAFKIPIDMGIFIEIPYYTKLSTTDIINKIKNN